MLILPRKSSSFPRATQLCRRRRSVATHFCPRHPWEISPDVSGKKLSIEVCSYKGWSGLMIETLLIQQCIFMRKWEQKSYQDWIQGHSSVSGQRRIIQQRRLKKWSGCRRKKTRSGAVTRSMRISSKISSEILTSSSFSLIHLCFTICLNEHICLYTIKYSFSLPQWLSLNFLLF